MGAPGCFVIIDAVGSRYYPGRWSGNRVCVTLLGGPEAATESIESVHRRDDDVGVVWLTEHGLDGGAVIDHPRRELAWFDDYDLVYRGPIRHAVMALLALLWPGWRVRWADRGATDLAAAAGLGRASDDPPLHPEPGPSAGPLSHGSLAALDEVVGLLAAMVNQTTTIAAFDQRSPPEFRWGRDHAPLGDATWSAVLLAAEELRVRWTAGS